MHNRQVYGYFRDESDAQEHLKKMKKGDRGTLKTFTYRCEKRNRGKEGRKRWVAYRLEYK
mgnify:FL=1